MEPILLAYVGIALMTGLTLLSSCGGFTIASQCSGKLREEKSGCSGYVHRFKCVAFFTGLVWIRVIKSYDARSSWSPVFYHVGCCGCFGAGLVLVYAGFTLQSAKLKFARMVSLVLVAGTSTYSVLIVVYVFPEVARAICINGA